MMNEEMVLKSQKIIVSNEPKKHFGPTLLHRWFTAEEMQKYFHLSYRMLSSKWIHTVSGDRRVTQGGTPENPTRECFYAFGALFYENFEKRAEKLVVSDFFTHCKDGRHLTAQQLLFPEHNVPWSIVFNTNSQFFEKTDDLAWFNNSQFGYKTKLRPRPPEYKVIAKERIKDILSIVEELDEEVYLILRDPDKSYSYKKNLLHMHLQLKGQQ